MKSSIRAFSLLVGITWSVVPGIDAQVNVVQEHNNLSRDGLYIDAGFTPAAAAQLTRDLNFGGTISGNVYAQPLYIEGGPSGPMIIAVTESNNVYALNATTGTVIWQRNLGPAVTSGLPCGNINPLGITGTPVVDLPSRSLFLDAFIDGPTKKHFIYSLNVDTGATNAGWPVDVNATATYNGMTFSSLVQNERGGLALVNGRVYVSYSGHAGDCGLYRGWVVGVDINNPSNVQAWATTAIGGGIWGHGGVASDGTNMFVITGNTFNTGGNWMGGEAIIRLQAGPLWTGQPTDYWAPTNWFSLDNSDTDLGGVSATLIDVPGATPSQLVLALGKDSNAYLLNRNNLGGIALPVTQANVGGINRGTSAVTYRTSQGTYFAFHNDVNTIRAYRITPTNPPTIAFAWSMSQTGRGSPWVTTTDGTNNFIVWVAGVAGDQRLHGYDGDTGAVIYAGGGVNELMTGTRQWNTGMVARGRIYFGADNKVYAFRLPAGTPTPTPTAAASATATPTATATFTPTPTPTATATVPSPTPIPSPTSTPTPTPVPVGTNVALAANGGVASASSTYDNNFPVMAVNDGDRLGLNWGNGGGWADGTPNVWPDWVEIDFNASYPINEIDFFTLQDDYQNPIPPTLNMTFTLWGVTDFEIQYWTGSTWADVPGGNVTGNNHVWRQFTFATITTAKIRVLINNALASYSRVTEIEAYNAGTNPTPTITPTATATSTPTATATTTATSTPTSTPTASATATATVPPSPTPAPTPTAPRAQNATNVKATSFTARWNSVGGATGYRLDVATDPAFVNYVPGYQNLDVGNVTNRSVAGLTPNTNYYYRVRAYNGNGTSPNSNVIKVKTKPH